MPRSHLVNAVDVALATDVAGTDMEITVDDAAPLPPVPFYLVIDPFGETTREYCRCTAVAGDVLSVERNLDGSESTTHTAGDIVRISYVAQILDDLWDGVEAPVSHNDLVDVTADQHHVRYTDDEARSAVEDIYLPLSGGNLTGDLDVNGLRLHGGRYITGPDTGHLVITAGAGREMVLRDDTLGNRIRIYTNATDKIEFFDASGASLFALAPGSILARTMLDMDNNKIPHLGAPTADTDAATKGYVDSQGPYLPLSGGTLTGTLHVPTVYGTPDLAIRDGEGDMRIFIYPDATNLYGPAGGSPILQVWDTGATVYKIKQFGAQSFAEWWHRNIWIGGAEPSSPIVGDIWMDTS